MPPTPDDTREPAAALTYQRAFTVGGEANVGGVIDLDGQGTFADLGIMAGGHFDAFVGPGDAITADSGVTYINIQPVSGANTYYRFEMGFHLAVKQLSGDRGTAIVSTLDQSHVSC